MLLVPHSGQFTKFIISVGQIKYFIEYFLHTKSLKEALPQAPPYTNLMMYNFLDSRPHVTVVKNLTSSL